MASPYGAAPYGGASPLMHPASPFQQPQVVPQAQQIQPGSITYTTSQGPDGHVVYHCFKAVAVSYQTANGVVSGYQWIPAEATSVLPVGATPAGADFNASFGGRPPADLQEWQREEERRRKKERKKERERERERQEEKEARKEERRREREGYARSRRASNAGYGDIERRFQDIDIQDRDRDREYGGGTRSRRGSFNGERPAAYQAVPAEPYPTANPSAYPRAPAYSSTTTAGGYSPNPYNSQLPSGQYPASGGVYPPRSASPYAPPGGQYPVRSASPYAPPGGQYPQRSASPYAPPGGAYPARSTSPYPPGGPYPARSASPYAPPPRPVSPYYAGAPHAPHGSMRPASPYAPPSGIPPRAPSPYGPPAPRTHSPIPVYPANHVLAGQPMRSASPMPVPYGGTANANQYGAGASANQYGAGANPNPYGTSTAPYNSAAYGAGAYPAAGATGYPQANVSPRMPAVPSDMLAAPEGFSRPPNRAQPYTHFEIMKIDDMENFLTTATYPRMPLVLVPHDVYTEDWNRLMADLALAWSGRLPVPEYNGDGRPPKRTILTADLLDLWNASFFIPRGVELVLYKGRERRSGRSIGTVDLNLPGLDTAYISDSDDDSVSLSSDDSEDDNNRYSAGAPYAAYGRQAEAQLAEIRQSRRLGRERRLAAKKRRVREKKIKQQAKELERKYALYLTCTTRDGGMGPQM